MTSSMPVRFRALLAAAFSAALGISAFAANPQVTMKTTLGDIVLELDEEKAPISTLNFLEYAQSKFYEGTVFHRVMPIFMIQGGGFTKDIDKKEEGLRLPIKNEWKNGLKNVRGTIAMARTGEPDSATSQFYINVVDNASLDEPRGGAAYAVFGKVIKGMETVDAIRDTETRIHPKYPGGKVVPVVPVIIESVTLKAPYDLTALKKKVEEIRQAAAASATQRIADNEVFLKENAQKPNVITTATGLQYEILETGNDRKPELTDTVKVHYRGMLIDGTEFDSSYQRNRPLTFGVNQVIPGWAEALQLISEGSKVKLVLPPDLAYGEAGVGDVIPPNSTLIFELELLQITSRPPDENAQP